MEIVLQLSQKDVLSTATRVRIMNLTILGIIKRRYRMDIELYNKGDQMKNVN